MLQSPRSRPFDPTVLTLCTRKRPIIWHPHYAFPSPHSVHIVSHLDTHIRMDSMDGLLSKFICVYLCYLVLALLIQCCVTSWDHRCNVIHFRLLWCAKQVFRHVVLIVSQRMSIIHAPR